MTLKKKKNIFEVCFSSKVEELITSFEMQFDTEIDVPDFQLTAPSTPAPVTSEEIRMIKWERDLLNRERELLRQER